MRLIVCITGMPGAGKTTVAKALANSFRVISMGDVIRKEAEKQNVEPTDTNLGNIMLKLREEYGLGAVAYLISKEIEKDNSDLIIDGLRSLEEVNVLKKYGKVKILAIHAPKEKRLVYLKERKRSDAPINLEEFEKRDKRELEVGIGEAISYADCIIMNDGSIEELQTKALEVIKRWKKELDEGKDSCEN